MSMRNEILRPGRLEPLIVSRVFPASRELVFQAWSSAEHLRQWFCPDTYFVPAAQVEFRVGGAFEVCMRSAEEQLGGSTRLEITQTYTILEPMAASMIEGASQGWRQTLDRLETEVARIQKSAPVSRSAVHATFCVERTYPVARAIVFKALTDPAAKAKWFGGGDGYTLLAREMDVRPGGREYVQGRWESGIVSTFDARYYDVIPDERIVYGYEMHLDHRKISVSLATFELKTAGAAATRLIMTEQGVYLDGYDDAGSRERGSNFLLDALGKSLTE